MLEVCKWVLMAGSVVCFLWAAFQMLRRWVCEPPLPLAESEQPTRRELLTVAAAVLAVALAYQAVLFTGAQLRAPDATLRDAVTQFFYGNTDAKHYIHLAEYGYGAGEEFPEQYLMIVFFPMFPVLLRWLNPLGLLDWGMVAIAVQPALLCWAGVNLYCLVRRSYGQSAARWTLAFLLVSPAAFYYAVPMTESLFLALSTGYILCLEEDRPKTAALLGLLAALTRSPGGLLFGVAFVWLVQRALRGGQWPKPAQIVAMLTPVAGLGLYFLLNWRVYGVWNQYAVYQKEHWHQALGLFPNTIAYHWEYMQSWWASSPDLSIYLCLTAVLCIVIAVALLTLAAKRLAVHHLAYGLAYVVVTMGVTWLISGPRYAVALFPLPLSIALLTRKRPVRVAVWLLLAVCGGFYLRAYLTGGPIY